jgi:hypothetical protein
MAYSLIVTQESTNLCLIVNALREDLELAAYTATQTLSQYHTLFYSAFLQRLGRLASFS